MRPTIRSIPINTLLCRRLPMGRMPNTTIVTRRCVLCHRLLLFESWIAHGFPYAQPYGSPPINQGTSQQASYMPVSVYSIPHSFDSCDIPAATGPTTSCAHNRPRQYVCWRLPKLDLSLHGPYDGRLIVFRIDYRVGCISIDTFACTYSTQCICTIITPKHHDISSIVRSKIHHILILSDYITLPMRRC